MVLDPKKIAEVMGAVHVGQLPDTGGGAFGAARLAEMLKERLQPSGGRPGQPGNVRWVLHPKVSISQETQNQLILLADRLSTPERCISPMQVAAELLEEAVKRRLQEDKSPPAGNPNE
jgi:hypothetical protein